MSTELKIFSGRSSTALASKIASYLGKNLGELEIKNFSDGEIWAKYGDNIRGADVFIIQSTNPPGDHIVELLILIDAARRASAKRITAVIPYFGYSRQDRKDQPRVAITAKLMANVMTVAGLDRIITMDLHASQIQGFFDIPFDHLYGSSIFINELRSLSKNLVVVSPDVGGIKLARAYANRLGASLVVSDKRRPKQNIAEIVNIIGEVEGKDVLLVDDLCDTAGTLVSTVAALKGKGAAKIFCAVTHPLLSGPSIDRINNSEIDKMFVLDTIPLRSEISSPKIEVFSAATVFAEAILRIHNNESISSLFDVVKS